MEEEEKAPQNETNECGRTKEIEIKRKQCEQQSLHQMVLQKDHRSTNNTCFTITNRTEPPSSFVCSYFSLSLRFDFVQKMLKLNWTAQRLQPSEKFPKCINYADEVIWNLTYINVTQTNLKIKGESRRTTFEQPSFNSNTFWDRQKQRERHTRAEYESAHRKWAYSVHILLSQQHKCHFENSNICFIRMNAVWDGGDGRELRCCPLWMRLITL